MTDAEIALFLSLRDQAVKWYRQSKPILREAARIQQLAAMWYRQSKPILREAARIQQLGGVYHPVSAFGAGVYLPPMRAPTQAISHEVQLPTRRRIGF